MKFRFHLCLLTLTGALLTTGQLLAQDGQGLNTNGQTLRFVQDTPTQFGDATGGGQDSAGGSEIDAVWGDINAGILNLSVSGNLEGNFNKLFLFFDGVAGGENTLAADNVDGGGFNEIQQFAGLVFDSGFTADHGLRFEIGGGFYGVNGFDLIDNTAFTVQSGGGPGDLPLTAVGSGGVTLGWDNSNILGVDGSSVSGALTATTGLEINIDLNTFFGSALQDVGVAGFVTNGSGDFLSNQVIGGLGSLSAGNLGDPTVVDFNAINGSQFVTIPNAAVPEPGSLALLLGGCLLGISRRRKVVT